MRFTRASIVALVATVAGLASAGTGPADTAKASPRCSLNLNAATREAQAQRTAGYRVGFALVTASGRTMAAVNATAPNYGASITKAMLLVAFLGQHGRGSLTVADRRELTAMIEVSANGAADWIYDHLRKPASAVVGVARDAGMTGFHLDRSDPVYVLGQSLVTAADFAGLFSDIQTLMPARRRAFGMQLLANVQERAGLLAAGLPGRVYSKEGWKPENAGALGAPYVVNQAAQFACDGVTYGVAVTVGGAADQVAAETVVQRIGTALVG